MNDKLEMPIEQFAEAVAKENCRLNEHNEKLKGQTKLYFDAFNKAIARIEKLEAALRWIAQNDYGLQGMMEDGTDTPEAKAEYYAGQTTRRQQIARKALEKKPDKSVYKEGYRAVEEAMGHPSPEFWVEKK